jgi:FkbM family methyltransferase
MHKLDEIQKKRLILVDKAVSINNGEVSFYPFDLQKYNNMGASSMLKIDFSVRNKDDPDYNIENPQKEIIVDGIRLDTFIDENYIENIDLLCIDLQGFELNAIKSLGNHLHKVKYIITECSIMSTYTNCSTFKELNDYLTNYNFKYTSSNKFHNIFPDLTLIGFSEFDSLFINQSAF